MLQHLPNLVPSIALKGRGVIFVRQSRPKDARTEGLLMTDLVVVFLRQSRRKENVIRDIVRGTGRHSNGRNRRICEGGSKDNRKVGTSYIVHEAAVYTKHEGALRVNPSMRRS